MMGKESATLPWDVMVLGKESATLPWDVMVLGKERSISSLLPLGTLRLKEYNILKYQREAVPRTWHNIECTRKGVHNRPSRAHSRGCN
jgi:hypothetical protein